MSDDKTTILPNDETKVPTTHPMLEAILARMNEGFAEVNAKIDVLTAEMNAKIDALSVEVAEFRVETNTRFEKVENDLAEFRAETNSRFEKVGQDVKRIDRKFEILTNRLLETEARQREVESRVDDLERKAS